MSIIPVPHGHLASVITHLEMTARPGTGTPDTGRFEIRPWENPGLDEYRALFRKVGLPWLWLSRLVMDDAELRAILGHENVHIYRVLNADSIVIGMIELDYRVAGECEIAFLGLVPEYNGRGHGDILMRWILHTAWAHDGVARVWLHTCSFDHPGALHFYRRSGFVPFRREIEILPDPRLTGDLPREAGPHIPIVKGRPAGA